MRSYLTVLGIVIGVASVVTLISISDGLYASVQSQLDAFGSNVVAIIPGSPSSSFGLSGGGYISPTAGRLFERDLQRIKRNIGVEYATKAVRVKTEIFFKRKNISITVNGIEPSKYDKVRNLEISEGRYLIDNDRGSALVGSDFAEGKIFDEPMRLGSFFYAGKDKKKFRVVGILDSASAVGASNIIMNFDDVDELAGNQLADKEISTILFSVPKGYNFDEVSESVSEDLRAFRGVREGEEDFTFVTAEFILKKVGELIAVLAAFLGFIISVSLLVGGVGVANTMFVSVLEKTKEIGTLKAIGAKSSDILLLIMFEAAIIGFIGGVLGVLLAYVVTLIISLFDFRAVITIYSAGFAIIFSMIISMVAGFIPALNASKLSPIVAMRYG